MSTWTDNFDFKKPDVTDFYDINVYNDTLDIIDEEMEEMRINILKLGSPLKISAGTYTGTGLYGYDVAENWTTILLPSATCTPIALIIGRVDSRNALAIPHNIYAQYDNAENDAAQLIWLQDIPKLSSKQTTKTNAYTARNHTPYSLYNSSGSWKTTTVSCPTRLVYIYKTSYYQQIKIATTNESTDHTQSYYSYQQWNGAGITYRYAVLYLGN